ncbi:DUF2971 domain-containing protein [Methylobacter tundripaludum]|uniref:DUF2971 domain-containing protein n=1 Tax=Methylobacter tundripaludum TaxID=173365 RepID=UPI0004DFC521|nr:DUF2971 domain-containing protein [Methylobacter tundripaludum]
MLYKYLPANRVVVLDNGEIRFTQPEALNDPFEALPLIDAPLKIKNLIESTARDAQNLWENTSPEEKTPENHKILQDTLKGLNAEILKNTSPSILGFKVMNGLDGLDGLNKKLGVLSLSRTFSNLLMWSHYAENHRGFVIGLDETHEFFHQGDCEGISTFPHKVSYTTQRSITCAGDIDAYEKILCEKPTDWAYEEEVRVFRNFTENTKISAPDLAGYPVYLFVLPKECIKNIYIGAHAQPELKEKILGFIRSHNLCADLYETKMSSTRYELKFEKCVKSI